MTISLLGSDASVIQTAQAATQTVNYTLPDGNNRLVVATIAYVEATAATAALQSLTLNSDINFKDGKSYSDTNDGVGIWYLLDSDLPVPGTYPVKATYDTNDASYLSVQAFQDVRQAGPTATGEATGSSSNLTAVVTTSDDNALILSILRSASSNATYTYGSDQTAINVSYGVGAQQGRWTYELKPSAGAATQAFVTANATVSRMAVAVFNFEEYVPPVVSSEENNAVLFSIAI